MLVKIYESVRSVLNRAVAAIKEISPDIISGEVRSFLKVHNKTINVTSTGTPIKRQTVASKITYFTDEQIIYT